MKKGKLGGVIAATHSLFHATRYCGATVELLRLILVLLLLVLCVALAPLTLQCSRVPLPANVSVGQWAPYSTDVCHRCFFSLLSIILGQFFFSFFLHSSLFLSCDGDFLFGFLFGGSEILKI